MKLELDHLFISTTADAPEVDELLTFGLTEGTRNNHPGQGTTNRRIFFQNAMLEFLWVENEQEVRSSVIAPTQLWERWQYRQSGYSPFGLCIRPEIGRSLPFATWAYRPPYLPPQIQIDIAAGTRPVEPLLFVIPFGSRPDTFPADRRQPLAHACGFHEITGLEIMMSTTEPLSPAIQFVHESGLVIFRAGDEPRLDVEFDQGVQGQRHDFRPTLPLRFRW
jgi:hypothetical protein